MTHHNIGFLRPKLSNVTKRLGSLANKHPYTVIFPNKTLKYNVCFAFRWLKTSQIHTVAQISRLILDKMTSDKTDVR